MLDSGAALPQNQIIAVIGHMKQMVQPSEYPRAEVCRMLNVSERQLKSWEKRGFVSPSATFGFSELIALKTLKRLSDVDIPPKKIQLALSSLRKSLKDIEQPLSQLKITAEGRRLAVHVAGNKMEPISGQLLLDFDDVEIEKLRAFPGESRREQTDEVQSEFWFQRGLALEETGAPASDAVLAYRKAIESNPKAAGTLVNLGTLLFRMRKLKEAESYYTRAVDADPSYPLAQFNLGNLYDEQGNAEEARKYYLNAIRLNPRYADAHFNLALLCERNNDILQAIGYWQTYLKLDSTSSWARAARKQLDRLKRAVRSK